MYSYNVVKCFGFVLWGYLVLSFLINVKCEMFGVGSWVLLIMEEVCD